MKPDKRALTQSGGSSHIGGNMLRFFLFDWILTYLETPEIYRTAGDEVLFYTAKRMAKDRLNLKLGDKLIITGGSRTGESGCTKTIRVEEI